MAKKKTSHKKEAAAPMADPPVTTTATNDQTPVASSNGAGQREPSPDRTEKLKQLNDILLKQTKEKREEVSKLQAQIEAMGEEFDFGSEMEREVMRAVLSAFVIDVGLEIGGRLREAEEARRKEVEKGRVLEEEVEGLRGEVRREVEKGRLAEEEKVVMLGRLEVKEKEVVELGKLVEQLETAKFEMGREIDRVCEEKEALVKEGKEKEGTIFNLRSEKGELEANLAECKKLVEKLEIEVQEEVKDKELKLGLLVGEKAGLEAKIASLEQEHGREVERLSSKIEGLGKKNAEGEGEIRELRATIDGKHERIAGLEKEIDVLQLAIQEAKKKGGIWSWIYPAATTILAAISFMYAAKAR